MTHAYTPLSLTRKLIAFNTVNPPGNERMCTEFIGELLAAGGFEVEYFAFAKNRTSLIARKVFTADRPLICFTGHFDTVPLGLAGWKKDPFGGECEGDRIFGRGASDMKGGLTAMIMAALRLASLPGGAGGLMLVLTAGEENGCEGARDLAERGGVLGRAGALVVGEPTANYPFLGHKGACWFEAVTTGVSAHGSMPDQGDNAVYKAARAITRLEKFDFATPPHPVLGRSTLNVGTISGGININSVPDRAVFSIDIRTVPGQDGDRIRHALASHLGEDVRLEKIADAPAVATDPQNQWVREVFEIVKAYIGEQPTARGVPYFTDASALGAALGSPPIVILGPGEPSQAHKTNEYCYLSRIEAAIKVYTDIGRRWCRL